MRQILGMMLAVVVGGWLALTPVVAQQPSEIPDVIGSQLQAFNDRDVERAWQFASPMIKGMFGTADNFGTMVRNGYPMVWDNADVQFLQQREFDSRVWQQVLVRGPDGALHMLDYQMIRTDDGWQINGVRIVPAPDVGA